MTPVFDGFSTKCYTDYCILSAFYSRESLYTSPFVPCLKMPRKLYCIGFGSVLTSKHNGLKYNAGLR